MFNLIKHSQKIVILAIIMTLPNFAFAKNHQVQMLNSHKGQAMVFKPDFLKINLGDKVTFIPTDTNHNSQSVFTPKNNLKWQGKDNEKITISFNEEGLYIYECANHAVIAMVGMIQVGKATNLNAAKKFAKDYKKTLAMNGDRVDNLFEGVDGD